MTCLTTVSAGAGHSVAGAGAAGVGGVGVGVGGRLCDGVLPTGNITSFSVWDISPESGHDMVLLMSPAWSLLVLLALFVFVCDCV